MRPDFGSIRRDCHGMMRQEVYERIYDFALSAPSNVFVEVGTGHGAATVCLAKALQDTGRHDGRVFTFDKFEGGSRKQYGNASENMNITVSALEKFGVSENVYVIDGDIAETSEIVPDDCSIGLLMLDCDGCIDRDFIRFLDRVPEGGAVIIDDYANRARSRDKGSYLRIDQKHRLTWLLTESAIGAGLIEHREMVNQTWFGVRGRAPVSDWKTSDIVSVYRKLVFTDAELPK